jgi:hypothetical protein
MQSGQSDGDPGERGWRETAETAALLLVGVALVGVGAAALFQAGRIVC